jgi:hypothetical protein
MSNYPEPQRVMDWIFPFRHEDNTAWERATVLGKILFPLYILFTAFRTIIVWAVMLTVCVPLIPVLYVTEHPKVKSLGEKIATGFKNLFVKAEP